MQEIHGVPFKMGREFDFRFLEKFGRVFQVMDDQDSGNICFGVEGADGKKFIKFAGAPTAEYKGEAADAVERLKATVPIYQEIKHPALIRYLDSGEIGEGFAMVFAWADGECMGRMYESSHKIIMNLPVDEKIRMFQTIIDFLVAVAETGYVAIDFYDGSILYDRVRKVTTICDIDFFRKSPAINDMGQMWGSSRFMSPEEYERGETLDEITNVFTIGQMGFSVFTDSDRAREHWPLSGAGYRALRKAISPERAERHASLAEFRECWERALR